MVVPFLIVANPRDLFIRVAAAHLRSLVFDVHAGAPWLHCDHRYVLPGLTAAAVVVAVVMVVVVVPDVVGCSSSCS